MGMALTRNESQSPTHLAHTFKDDCAVVSHAFGPALEGQRQNRGELGRLFAVDAPGRGFVEVVSRRVRAVDAGAPFDDVEVELKNALLAEDEFSHRHQCELRSLAEDGAARAEEQVLYQLLREGGTAADTAAFHIVLGGDLNRLPIEPMVLVKPRVLGRDDSVLEIERDLAERNESVVFLIRLVVNPGLQTALDVDGGGRWVDPPEGHKGNRGKRPKCNDNDDKPLKKGPEKTFPARCPRGFAERFSHISE